MRIDLRDRVQIVFLANTLAESPQGAMAWIARIAGVRPRTVRRYCAYERDPTTTEAGQRFMKSLEAVEAEVSLPMRKEVWERLKARRENPPASAGDYETAEIGGQA